VEANVLQLFIASECLDELCSKGDEEVSSDVSEDFLFLFAPLVTSLGLRPFIKMRLVLQLAAWSAYLTQQLSYFTGLEM
jgi:hypothetical protein